MMLPAATLGSLVLGPVEFAAPWWLVALPVLWALTVWIGRRSLSGLGGSTRWVALGVRLAVLLLIVAALAEPSLRRESRDVALTVLVDGSQSVPTDLQRQIDAYIERAAIEKRPGDRLGAITVARRALVQTLPSALNLGVERRFLGRTDGTNLAEGVQLAIATIPSGDDAAAGRILLASDGNETEGSLLEAAQAARAAGVPIDVFPLRYLYDNEVIVERLVVPPMARMGDTISLRVNVHATRPTRGRINILQNDEPIDLDPETDAIGVVVDLQAGLNPLTVQIPLTDDGAQRFEAVFEPETLATGALADAITQNNRALGVTFVSGEGKVLVLSSRIEEYRPVVDALQRAEIACEVLPAERAPGTLADFNSYDAVVMINQPVYPFSEAQLEAMRQYVHDSGGGLVMIGGDEAFGAGGWIGSAIEDALPIRLDPPQKRQMPRGALALVIHSVESPNGVSLGKECCIAAVNALSRLDLAGIIEYSWGGGNDWVHPLSEIGDGSAVKQAINNLTFGDMPSFDPSLQLALAGLRAAQAGQKHVIVISDGDPSLSNSLLTQYRDAGITISGIGVFPHSNRDLQSLQRMATVTGGRFYSINTNAAIATVPQIFIKEAQTVRRSLIWEGDGIQPRIVAGADSMRGISAVPPITGYVVAADREGLAQVTLRAGDENDPVGAQWQYGLGRVVTHTSDATTKWARSWITWEQFEQFWEQHVRWAMRPSGSANVMVTTEDLGDRTRVVVDAVGPDGERLPTASFKGRLATPDGEGAEIELRQVGPGRFEAVVDSSEAGTYVASLRYAAPSPTAEGEFIEGTVQAAITRPFADEFRALEDNAALLVQVAELTGGRVIRPDVPPEDADLWAREGLVMPVSTRPIWLIVALCGIGLFLFDVAVRRVRIDFRAMAMGARRAVSKSAQAATTQMDSLTAARAKARERLAGRAAPEADAELQRAAPPAPTREDLRARKFEATAEQIAASRAQPVALSGQPSADETAKRAASPTDQTRKPEPEEGMSALLRAKKRAQERLEDDRPRND